MTSDTFAKLQIETDIGGLDLGRTEVRLPQMPVQKADLNKQLSPERWVCSIAVETTWS